MGRAGCANRIFVPAGEMNLPVQPEHSVEIDPTGAMADARVQDGRKEARIVAADGRGPFTHRCKPRWRMIAHPHHGVHVAVHHIHGAAVCVKCIKDGTAIAEHRQGAVRGRLARQLASVEVLSWAVIGTAPA